MKKIVFILSLVLLVTTKTHALLGVNLGVKYGQGKFKSLHFDEASIKGSQFGGQILFTLLPFFDLEIGSDYFKKTYDINYQSSASLPGGGSVLAEDEFDVSFKSIGIYAGMRFKLDLPLIPFVPYAGGGIGNYQIKYQFEGDIKDLLDDEEFTHRFEIPKDKKDDFGVHFNAGVRSKWMFVPIQVFVEGKYAVIFDSYKNLKNYGIFVGILFPVL